MGVFDCEVTKRMIIVNGKKHYYNREYYKYLNKTYYVIHCPKYLQSSLIARFKSYGVDYHSNDRLSVEKESIIETLYIELEKGEKTANKHRGQEIYSISYDKDYNLNIVFISYNSNPYYMVNHTDKTVSPVHGFLCAGKDFARNHNYTFKSNI